MLKLEVRAALTAISCRQICEMECLGMVEGFDWDHQKHEDREQ